MEIKFDGKIFLLWTTSTDHWNNSEIENKHDVLQIASNNTSILNHISEKRKEQFFYFYLFFNFYSLIQVYN